MGTADDLSVMAAVPDDECPGCGMSVLVCDAYNPASGRAVIPAIPEPCRWCGDEQEPRDADRECDPKHGQVNADEGRAESLPRVQPQGGDYV